MAPYLPAFCAGRFITGFCSGVLSIAMLKSIQDTAPLQYQSKLNLMHNFYNQLGIMCALLSGLFLPTDPNDYLTDERWRVIFGLPILFAFV